jgi:hypothetical protein
MSTSHLLYYLVVSSFNYDLHSSIYIYPLFALGIYPRLSPHYVSGGLVEPLSLYAEASSSIDVATCSCYLCCTKAFVETIPNQPIKVLGSRYNCITVCLLLINMHSPWEGLGLADPTDTVYQGLLCLREPFYDGNSKSIPRRQLL